MHTSLKVFLRSALAGAGLLAFASAQAQVAAPMPDVNGVIDNTPDSILQARMARPVAGSSRNGNRPVLFTVGNSTMRTGTKGNGNNGQWGWGYFFPDFFDKDSVTVENHALGGMSTRTFYTRLWPDVLKGVQAGDYVMIELGHNDNGPYDSGRARATIPGIGTDSLCVTIAETGEKETVYTYGEYLRRYINQVKAKGAYPILLSLTPRKAWDEAGRVVRVDKTFGLWARQVAEAEDVPFIDLNEISASKYDTFGPDKVEYMFYLDRIHTSQFGAVENARSAAEGLRQLDIPLARWLKPEPAQIERKTSLPAIFLIGDSTVKNKDADPDDMWGWGAVLAEQFDSTKVEIINCAKAGRSARTFLDEGRWDEVYRSLRPGDMVIMQFGPTDGGDIHTGKARGELHGAGPESKVFLMEPTGRYQVIYTYGWYLRKFIGDAHEKGATAVVVSHTPRNKWDAEGRIESNADSYGLWSRQAAAQMGAPWIDLNGATGAKLQALGPEAAAEYFKKDHTHSSLKGARLNASTLASLLPPAFQRLR